MLPLQAFALLCLVGSGASAASTHERRSHPARQASPPGEKRAVNLGWPYVSQKIRGVNLGGWLVLEPWITPSLFDKTGNSAIVDEYTFGQLQTRATAEAALKNHWDTFITQDDFYKIRDAGLNHVRIPIGYWAFEVDAPYIQGQLPYLYKAIGWARNAGIKVMIDLHGAPGSQNGFDNSGRFGKAEWATQSSYVSRTKAVIQTLAEEFSKTDYWQVVTALQLLNEPAGFLNQQLLDTTLTFYNDGYYTARYPWAPKGSASKSGLLVVMHDAFQSPAFFNGRFQGGGYEDIMIDTHHYEIFSNDEVARDRRGHLQSICNLKSSLEATTHSLVVGEWSGAITDCAKYLNGRGIGSRFDGSYPGSTKRGDCPYYTGNGDNFTQEYKTYLRQFWEAQVQTFERSADGWIMWTWKNEGAAEWSYQRGLQLGWIPQNPTQYANSLESLCA